MNFHLIGIGGVGMSGLAVLLSRRGHRVSGCDIGNPRRTEWLRTLGIEVFGGHDPSHLAGVDEVIATPAVRTDNPEIVSARSVRYRGDVLAEIVSDHPDSIAVCGSHGKTTTSTWIARLLIALGENVEWAIGGETGDFPVAGCAFCGDAPASPGVLVVEADESDGTLAGYHAKTLIVTNCDYDHPDHFKTRREYAECYDTARRNAGSVIEGEELGPLECGPWMDELAPHNRKNARMAIEVALRRGHAIGEIVKAMPTIVASLPDRRFQKLVDGVYTDYAHHPTEIACAISMARKVCRGKLRVLFQPHRYSRTKALIGEFPLSFVGADEVVICPTYAAFERPVEGGDSADLYAACRKCSDLALSCRWYFARSCDEAWEHARNSSREGDVTLILGAGDIIALAERTKTELPLGGGAFARRRQWIGMGTNTLKSDLELSVDYVETKSPAGRPGASLEIPWMAGIPGTIGGWVKMNAGAFGHSISEVVRRVLIDGEWVDAADCGFGYRTSNICGEIQDVELKQEVVAVCRLESAGAYLAKRHRFPSGTKGSVFRNPPGDFAGRLLENVGAKEMRVGGARVWEGHANVIVSGPEATASDFLALARLMQLRVWHRFGIELVPEVVGLS